MFDTTIEIEPCEEGGFTVTVPALPGCISEGDTKEEALKNITEAILLHLWGMLKEKDEMITRAQNQIEDWIVNLDPKCPGKCDVCPEETQSLCLIVKEMRGVVQWKH